MPVCFTVRLDNLVYGVNDMVDGVNDLVDDDDAFVFGVVIEVDGVELS